MSAKHLVATATSGRGTVPSYKWERVKEHYALLGGVFVVPKKRHLHGDTDFIHPLWYVRFFKNRALLNGVKDACNRVKYHKYRTEDRIPIALVYDYGIGDNHAYVCMKLGDFRDLCVGREIEYDVEEDDSPIEIAEGVREDPFEFLSRGRVYEPPAGEGGDLERESNDSNS